MILAVAIVSLLLIPLLTLVTFVQLLYLESLRLRPRDLRSLRYFKSTLEDRLGLDTEKGAGSFSLIKHTILVIMGITWFAWFADGRPWTWAALFETVAAVWITMVTAAYAMPQILYRRTAAEWLLPLAPFLLALSWLVR